MSEHDRDDNLRSAALSVALEAMVRSQTGTARRRKTAAAAVVGFIAAGALTGGAVSAAVAARPEVMERTSDESNLVELIRTVGEPEARRVGDPIVFAGSGNAEISLDVIPEGVTQLAIAFDCVDPGSYGIAIGNIDGPFTAQCEAGFTEVNIGGVFTASPEVDRALYVTAAKGHRYSLRAAWITGLPDGWQVNANGQTYGVGSDGTAPDLIAAVGVDAAGNEVDGYLLSVDAIGPKPASPEAAVAQRAERRAAHPGGVDLPLYTSDGMTRVGTSHVG